MKQFALPTLCDLAHASKATRKIFWQHDGLHFYLTLLEDVYWQAPALESIVVWLQDETARVESVLLQPDSIRAMVTCFNSGKGISFENMLEPLVKISRQSFKLAISLSEQPSFLHKLADRLAHPKALVRLNLLRIVRVFCEVSPSPDAVLRRERLVEVSIACECECKFTGFTCLSRLFRSLAL